MTKLAQGNLGRNLGENDKKDKKDPLADMLLSGKRNSTSNVIPTEVPAPEEVPAPAQISQDSDSGTVYESGNEVEET